MKKPYMDLTKDEALELLAKLTPSERDIADKTVLGLTAKEIANCTPLRARNRWNQTAIPGTCVQYRTVDTHKQSIKEKLGTTNPAALAYIYVTAGVHPALLALMEQGR